MKKFMWNEQRYVTPTPRNCYHPTTQKQIGKKLNEYGHIGTVNGVSLDKSPCCNAIHKTVELMPDESGFTPTIDLCYKCGKKYNAINLHVI